MQVSELRQVAAMRVAVVWTLAVLGMVLTGCPSRTIPSVDSGRETKHEEQPSVDISAVGEKQPTAAQSEIASSRAEENALITLTGLYGGSWVDEAPWLMPYLRSEFSRALPAELKGSGRDVGDSVVSLYSHDVDRVYERLESEFRTFVENEKSGDLQRREWLKFVLSREWRLPTAGDDELQRLLLGLKTIDDPHTQAVLYASVAKRDSLQGDAELDPKKLFEEALLRYSKQASAPAGLTALCLADYGAYLASEREHDESIRRFREARMKITDPASAPLFLIYCYCSEANIFRGQGRWDLVKSRLDAALKLANEHLRRADEAANYHPLLAHIHERFAWQFMDQWKVVQAREHFRAALKIWEAFHDHTGGDPRSTVAILHNKHGLAMANRYSGDVEQAVAEYSALVGQIKQERDQTDDPELKLKLTGRLINTYERLADCNLFRAGGQPEHADKAAEALQNALDESDALSRGTTSDTGQGKLRYKLALVELQRGNAAAAEIQMAEIKKLQLPTNDDLLNSYAFAVSLVQKLGPSTADLKQAASAELEDVFAKSKETEQRLNRDKLDLWLLLCDNLQDRVALADQDVDSAFGVVPHSFVQVEVLPYLRPFFDQLISNYVRRKPNIDLDRLTAHIWTAKNCESLKTGGSVVLFYYPNEEELGGEAGKGLVIVRYKDGQQELIELEQSLNDVRSAADGETKHEFPQRLLEIGKREGFVQVFWFDKALGLNNDSFPFEKPAGFKLVEPD